MKINLNKYFCRQKCYNLHYMYMYVVVFVYPCVCVCVCVCACVKLAELATLPPLVLL